MLWLEDVLESAKADWSAAVSLKQQQAQAQKAAILQAYPSYADLEKHVRQTAVALIDMAYSKPDLWQDSREKTAALHVYHQAKKELSSFLDQHQLPPEEDLFSPYCPLCNDKGVRMGEICNCVRIFYKRRLYQYLMSNVPYPDCLQTYRLSLFSADKSHGLSPKEQYLKIHRHLRKVWGKDPQRSEWIILGKPGTGKSFLANVLCEQLWHDSEWVPACFVSAAEIMDTMNQRQILSRSFQPDLNRLRALSQRIDLFKKVDALVIDDFGFEHLEGEQGVNLWLDLLSVRHQAGLATLMTTSYQLKGLSERYGERFASKIFDWYDMVTFNWQDLKRPSVK